MRSLVARATQSLKSAESLKRAAQLLQQVDANPGLIDRLVAPESPCTKLALEGIAKSAFGDGGAEFLSIGAVAAAAGPGLAVHAYTCAATTMLFRETAWPAGKDPAAFSRHSVAVAAAAGLVSGWSGGDASRARVAGALHNVGLAVMLWGNPDTYGRSSSPIAGTEAQVHDMEADLLGYDHQEAGALFLGQLGFPADITDVAASHHKSDATGLTKAVQTADLAAHQMGCDMGFANAPAAEAQGAFSALGDEKVARLAEAVSAVTLNFARLAD